MIYLIAHEDANGGLLRLENKLLVNGLVIKGVMDVTNHVIPEILLEMVNMCHLDGAPDTEVPAASVPFRSLVQIFGSHDLL